jgi:hypothetical protein
MRLSCDILMEQILLLNIALLFCKAVDIAIES